MNKPNKPFVKKKPFSLTNKKKSTSDWITRDYINRKKRGADPLQNMRPRPKGVYRIMENERQEVKNILYPFIEDFLKIRLYSKKMPKTTCNDRRTYIVEYFKESPQNPNKVGPVIIDTIFEETEGKFTKEEITNTLINKIYQHKIDYLHFAFKNFVSQVNKSESLSLWNKISEPCHV
jgi:hypothetical protein